MAKPMYNNTRQSSKYIITQLFEDIDYLDII